MGKTSAPRRSSRTVPPALSSVASVLEKREFWKGDDGEDILARRRRRRKGKWI